MNTGTMHLLWLRLTQATLGFAGAGLILFILRWISRGLIRTWYRWEDSFFVFASILNIAAFALGFVATEDASARFSYFNPGGIPGYETWTMALARWLLVLQILPVWCLFGYHVSLLASYNRLFEPGPTRPVIYGGLVLVSLATIASFIIPFVQCYPLQNFLGGKPVQCMNVIGLGIIVPQLAASVCVLAVPLFYVRSVTWRTTTFIAAILMALFSLFIILVFVVGVFYAIGTVDERDRFMLFQNGLSVILFGYMCLCGLPNLHPLVSRRVRAEAREPFIRLDRGSIASFGSSQPFDRVEEEGHGPFILQEKTYSVRGNSPAPTYHSYRAHAELASTAHQAELDSVAKVELAAAAPRPRPRPIEMA